MKLIPRLDLTVVDLGGVEKISRGVFVRLPYVSRYVSGNG